MPKITVPVVGQYGLVKDQPNQELPVNAWSRAVNMRFRDGCAERMEGESSVLTTPSITPYYIDAFQTSTARLFVYAGTGKVYVDDGTTRTEITPASDFTGTQDDRWTGGTLNGVLIMNNGVERPQYWAGGTGSDLANLTGWSANWKAAVVRPFKNYLIALDLTKSGTRYPHMVKWSAAADPGTVPASWDETDPTIDAGELDLAEEPSQMVDCLPMGDMNIIYKERAMFAQTLGGADFIWNFRKLPGDVGALARGCIANFPGGHAVLTAGDVISHSGQGPQSIINARMRKWLFNNLDSDNYKRSFLVSNPPKNEVWVCIPTPGDSVPTIALVWNYVDDNWTVRELNSMAYACNGQVTISSATAWSAQTGTWATWAEAWNSNPFAPTAARLVGCSTSPLILLADSGGTYSGTSYTSVLEREGMAFDSPDRVKVLKGLYPRFDAANGTQIRVEFGGSMDAEKGPTWSAPVTYTVGTSYRVDSFATGRFLAVRFTSLDDSAWRLKSYDVDIEPMGTY